MPDTAPHRLSDADLLHAAGEAMHGRDWRRSVARGVGVSGSLVAAVVSGRVPMSRRLQHSLAAYAAREADAEVPRARRRVALLAELKARFADRL